MAITLNRATANTKILSAEYNENMTDIEDLVNQEATLDGWADAGEAWAYSSVDDPTGIITVPPDATTKYSTGMRIRFVNATNTIYGIITAVTATTITFLHEIDPTDSQALHLMANSAITVPKYSTQKAPFGFPLSPTKWTIETTATGDESQATPSGNTWYNPGTLIIDIPIGVWNVEYLGCLGAYDAASITQMIIKSTLSTANNSESDAGFTAMIRDKAGAIAGKQMEMDVHRSKEITLATKDTYYLNVDTVESGVDLIGWNIGTIAGDTIIRAVCAYL